MTKLGILFVLGIGMLTLLFVSVTLKMEYCIQKVVIQDIIIFIVGLTTGSYMWDSMIFPSSKK